MTTIGRSAATALAGLGLIMAGVVLSGAKPAGPSDTPNYDSKAEYAVKGTVAGVKEHDSVQGYKDTHIILTTVQGDMEVHVGPSSFLAKRGFEVKPGEELLVIGCKTLFEDKPVLVAREIRKGDHKLTLRGMRGNPVWPKNLTG
jgi:hypothetical protein